MFLSLGADAKTGLTQLEIPDELRPWVPWVLHGQETMHCPLLAPRAAEKPGFACAWPGELTLSVNSGGGRFSQSWRLLAPDWVLLPGDDKTWPQAVAAGGREVPVVSRGGRPAIYLEIGTHKVTGVFHWSARPANLAVPEYTALVSLEVDNQPVAFPERNGNGLWLGQRGGVEKAAETAEFKVFRLLQDGSPMLLTTRLSLRVSGKAREEVLGTALPAGFIPMDLTSPLPARIEADGSLRVQLRPGTWDLQYLARATADPAELALPQARAKWPAQEIWTYVPDTVLRESRLLGSEPVDDEQVGVPADWRGGASGVVGADSHLTIEERARGQSDRMGNRLSLNRTLYLDFEGDGFTALDEIHGQMRQDWRLDTRAPFELQHARSGQDDLLVTAGAEPSSKGVEVRDAALQLSAVSRLGGPRSDMPVTGWTQDFDQVSALLQLPPGYHLLAAPGVDAAGGAWVNGWTLMDLFLVLLVSVALSRLMGRPVGVLAIVVLVLLHQWMPAITWALLNLVIATAVFGVAPEGRLRNLARRYQLLGMAILVLLVLPFTGDLAIKALYPQLERGGLAQEVYPEARYALERSLQVQDMAYEVASEEMAVTSSLAQSELKRRGPAAPPPPARYAPGLLVQTGPGVPRWNWNQYALNWGGPVDAQRTFSLVVSPPWVTFLWRLLGILGLLGLTGLLMRRCMPSSGALPGASSGLGAWLHKARTHGLSTGLVLVMACSALATPEAARAEFPGPELLKELQQRLLERPDCEPACVEIPSATVHALPGHLEIGLSVHAQAGSLLALPDAGAAWLPRQILLNGEPQSFALLNNGIRYLLVPEGVSKLVLKGEMSARDLVELVFAQRPRALALQLEGWEAAGLQDDQLTAGTLQLIRKGSEGSLLDGLSAELAPEKYPAFLRVTRTLTLGLEWSVATEARRLAPGRGAISVLIPLLPGEAVVSRDQEVKDDTAVVNLAPDQASAGWLGALPAGVGLSLLAGADVPWVETWRIAVGPQWRPGVSGVPVSASNLAGWVMEYYPRPGESLELSAVQPEAAPGATFAIDHVSLSVQPGESTSNNELNLEWRSSRGGEHRIRLPSDALLLGVSTDNVDVSLSLQDGELVLPVAPGAHSTRIVWSEERGVSAWWHSSAVDLGAPASNLDLRVNLPESRWVLGSFGPRLGPAVLYWGQFIVFLMAALVVSRLPHAPFPFRDWLLLGLGLSMVSWITLVLFVAWAFAMAWRTRCDDLRQLKSADSTQAVLAVVTVIAIGSVVAAIPEALLGQPDMQIRGWYSQGNLLAWFQDQTTSAVPALSVISLSMWVYKAVMLAWALWLSVALVRWLRWAWGAWTRGGHWLGRVARTAKVARDSGTVSDVSGQDSEP
ncbi:MAG: hypothetical protein MUP90_07440 [Gammaproteobacteria bacterium]|nr:hypothetical protein [Gammaproteobacteria bacterium]